MPLTDIVVDTCVLMHANDPTVVKHQEESLDFIDNMLKSNTCLSVDNGALWDDTNRSKIVHEYRENIKTGVAFHFLVAIFSSKKYTEYSLQTHPHVAKKVNQCLSHNKPRDKSFLKLAINSISKTLVTHDREDFDDDKRNYIKTQFGVEVVDAHEATL